MDVTLIISGTRYSLSDGGLCQLDAWEGLGLNTPVDLASQGPQQRGDTDEGYQFNPRFFSLVLKVTRSSEGELDTARESLLKLLKASSLSKQFEFTLKNGVVRYLDAKYISVEVGERLARRHQKVGATFKANLPDFYSSPGQAVTFGQSGGSAGFVVPVVVPMAVGASTLGETVIIPYVGTAPTFPSIRITGPITDPVFEHVGLGEKIDFTGKTIGAGHYYEIDLRYGFKRVVDDLGVYVSPSSDSDLATLRLAPEPDVTGGLNELKLSGSGVTGATKADVSWINRYESL